MQSRSERPLRPAAGRELRMADITSLQIRAAATADGPIGFAGTCAVMNVRAQIGGKYGWLEQVATGAFDNTISVDDIRMLKNHNSDLPIARTAAGSLRLAVEGNDVTVDADMDPVSYVRDLAISLERGTVTGMSIGFEVKEDSWIDLDESDPDYGKTYFDELRTIRQVKLWEVSPVTFPAYVDTDASLRAHELELLARGLELDEEQLHTLAGEIRSGSADITRIRALAIGDEHHQAPATGSSAPAIEPPPTTRTATPTPRLAIARLRAQR